MSKRCQGQRIKIGRSPLISGEKSFRMGKNLRLATGIVHWPVVRDIYYKKNDSVLGSAPAIGVGEEVHETF